MNGTSRYQRYFFKPILHFATDQRIKIYPRLIGSIFLATLALFFIFNRVSMNALGKTIGVDFIAFYTGARFFINGMMDRLYDLTAQAAFQHQLIEQSGLASDQINDSFTAFISPPFATLLYFPFGHENYLIGYAFWMFTNIACFVFSLYLIKSNWFTHSKLSLPVLVISGLSFAPTFIWILYGQATGILFLLLTLALIMLRKEHEFLGGFVLGICAFKPQIAVCIAASLILGLRWRALIGGGLAVSIWLALGLVIFPTQMQEYWELRADLFGFLVNPEFKTWGVHSLYGFSHLLLGSFSNKIADYFWFILSIGVLSLLARFWLRTPWQPGSKQWDRGMAGAFAISMLLSVQLYSYDLTLLLIPFLLMAASFPAASYKGRLDNGNILIWTIVVYVVCALAPGLSNLELVLTSTDSFGGMGLQLSTFCIAVWGIYVLKSSVQVQRLAMAESGDRP